MEEGDQSSLFEKLNAETAKMPWRELQRFFASGTAIYVSEKLDLLDAAMLMNKDDASTIKKLMDDQAISVVSDQQALTWFDSNALVWALVIKPWVLVQPIGSKD